MITTGVVGLALSDDDEFDWDVDDDYESPFADEADEPFEVGDEPDENPFDDAADEPEEDDDASPPASSDDGSEEGTNDSENDHESSSAEAPSEAPDESTPPASVPDEDPDPEPSSSTGSESETVSEEEPSSRQEAPSEQEPSDESEALPEADASTEPDALPETEADQPTLATVADARALCDEAMDLQHAGETARAFGRLSAHWAFSQDEMTKLQREVERTRAVVADRYGDALDYRLVREDTTADVLARFVYLERFELHGLRWRFTFYEGASGWTLNDVFFDDEVEALLG